MQQEGKTVWQLQEELRKWHDSEYIQAYPNSTFFTGQTLTQHYVIPYEQLPPEEKERKEWVAYRLNRMLFNMGVNVSGSFREERPPEPNNPATADEDGPFLDD